MRVLRLRNCCLGKNWVDFWWIWWHPKITLESKTAKPKISLILSKICLQYFGCLIGPISYKIFPLHSYFVHNFSIHLFALFISFVALKFEKYFLKSLQIFWKLTIHSVLCIPCRLTDGSSTAETTNQRKDWTDLEIPSLFTGRVILVDKPAYLIKIFIFFTYWKENSENLNLWIL